MNLRNLFLILSALAIPLSAARGQDEKTEKKIKVIVDDGSGAKTVIDTSFTNGSLPDSVILKNGKVVYFTGSGKEVITGKSPKNMYVTVTSSCCDKKNKEQTVIVTSDDSTRIRKPGGNGTKHIYAYSSSGTSGEKPESQTIIITDGDKDLMAEGEKVMIIKDGKVIRDESDKDYNTLEKLEKNDNGTEMTKYVIAKDGVVVTVESNDEAKAKDLIKDIENKLGVNKENIDKKEISNTETSKTVKK